MANVDQLVVAIGATLCGLLAWSLSRIFGRLESDIKNLWSEVREVNRSIQAIANRITIIEVERSEGH